MLTILCSLFYTTYSMSERKLNQKQHDLILIVYRFRYVTTENLAKQRNISTNAAYSALEILHAGEYLGKIHKKSYRLQNKSARYYLAPKAIKYLQQVMPDTSLDSRLRERTRSEAFIDQQVAIHGACVALGLKYGDDAVIMTGPEMSDIEGIIKPLPSLFVKPKQQKHYFIELTDGQHLFIVKKRIRKYIDHYESDDWEWGQYPDVHVVRSSKSGLRKLKEYADEKMEDAYLDEDDFSFVFRSLSDIDS